MSRPASKQASEQMKIARPVMNLFDRLQEVPTGFGWVQTGRDKARVTGAAVWMDCSLQDGGSDTKRARQAAGSRERSRAS